MTDTNKINPRTTVYNNKGLKIQRGYHNTTNEIVWFFSDGTYNSFLNFAEINCLIDVLKISQKFSVALTDRTEEI